MLKTNKKKSPLFFLFSVIRKQLLGKVKQWLNILVTYFADVQLYHCTSVLPFAESRGLPMHLLSEGSMREQNPNYHQRKSNAVFFPYFREMLCYLGKLNLVNHIYLS